MNGIRNLLGTVLALVFAAFALPGYAASQSQNKTYSLDMTVLVQGNSTASSQVKAVLKNTSPASSSSTFSSVDIFVDLGWKVDDTQPVTVVESAQPTVFYVADISQAGHIKVQNLYPVKPFVSSNNQLEITFYVKSASCGDGSWEGNVWSGSQLGSGNFFTRNGGANIAQVACSSLACGDSVSIVVDPTVVSAARDFWNKDGTLSGTACNAVNYYASNTLNNYVGLPQDIVHFRWDQSGTNQTYSSAAFQYYIFYSTPTAPNTRVGWLYLNGQLAVDAGSNPNANTSNPVIFIDTPLCLSPVSPHPYGSLNSPLNSSSTTVKIDTSTGSSPPPPTTIPPGGFPIYIEQERMQVTAYASNGWTVMRGQMGTTAVSHPKYALVMSTPLPPIPASATAYLVDGTLAPSSPYVAGAQAQMCLASSGTMPDSNQNLVPYNLITDIGDGWGTVR